MVAAFLTTHGWVWSRNPWRGCVRQLVVYPFKLKNEGEPFLVRKWGGTCRWRTAVSVVPYMLFGWLWEVGGKQWTNPSECATHARSAPCWTEAWDETTYQHQRQQSSPITSNLVKSHWPMWWNRQWCHIIPTQCPLCPGRRSPDGVTGDGQCELWTSHAFVLA